MANRTAVRNSLNSDTCRILADGVLVSNNTWETGLNNNDLIIGPSGAGKTRNYVKPNLMQMNESFVVTDTKGSLLKDVGPLLEREGYKIMHVDFTDVGTSYGYNPLDFVRVDGSTGRHRDEDIMRIARAFCPAEDFKEPFWDNAARNFIAALVAYVLECLPEEEQTLEYVYQLAALPNEELELLMRRRREEDPHSFSVRSYAAVMVGREADRMTASIRGVAYEKLSPLVFDGAAAMYAKPERISFIELGECPCALFVTVSDTNRSMDRLVSLLYEQAIFELCAHADKHCAYGALPVPVRLFLDDFATNCKIENFDNLTSVIRSRGIAVSVVLQSITQLDALYGQYRARTIIANCDYLLYLGGQDLETAEYIARRCDRMRKSILEMPVGRAWLLESHAPAQLVRRYDITCHPRFPDLERYAMRSAGLQSVETEGHGDASAHVGLEAI